MKPLTLIDMNRAPKDGILLDVLSEDIWYGVRKNCVSCPIARALKRQFSTNDVEVGAGYIEVFGLFYNTMDTNIPIFVSQFDMSLGVSPSKFILFDKNS